jgi:uncharacterized protein
MFDTFPMIVGGILTGLVFGFLLQKAHVTRYSVILGQFLFTDFTVLKVMLTAIVTGGIGIYAMYGAGWIPHLQIKTAAMAAVILGGLIFGVGMALLGYCPGTGVAAVGDGSRHAIYGLLGMVAGAALYAETMPYFKNTLLKAFDYGKISFADATHLSPWIFIVALALLSAGIFLVIERWEKGVRRSTA